MRKRAAADPQHGKTDELGGIILHSDGHPGAPQACSEILPTDYSPPPPALKMRIEGSGEEITVTGFIAPECQVVKLERSDDNGSSWQEVGEGDPKTIPGPPGPKNVPITNTLSIGASAQYRMIAHNCERIAKPSEVVEITACEVPAEEDSEDDGKGEDAS